jgi:hypothetical protein
MVGEVMVAADSLFARRENDAQDVRMGVEQRLESVTQGLRLLRKGILSERGQRPQCSCVFEPEPSRAGGCGLDRLNDEGAQQSRTLV